MKDRFTKDAWWQATCINLNKWGYETYANVLTVVKPQPRNWYVLRYAGTKDSWDASVYKDSKVFTPFMIVEAASGTDAHLRITALEPDLTIDWFAQLDWWWVDQTASEWEACFVKIKHNLTYPYIVALLHANDMVQHVSMEE